MEEAIGARGGDLHAHRRALIVAIELLEAEMDLEVSRAFRVRCGAPAAQDLFGGRLRAPGKFSLLDG
jgi:hypothetical protein